MRPFLDFENVRRVATTTGPRVTPEGRVPRPFPQSPGDLFHQTLVKKWHLTPWVRRNLLDIALSDDATDSTSWTDVLNNLVSQAGNVMTARSLPAGYTPMVPRPTPGQVVPMPAQTKILGMTPLQLGLVGAAVLGGIWILRKR